MENQVSEVLENILSLLAMEGSFEVSEGEDEVSVLIETEDAGRLIGVRGETIDGLQLLVNQIVSRQNPDQFKRVVVDVGGWRKNKEEELVSKARRWAEEVLESGQEMELEPMPAWQRRVIHLTIEGIEGVGSESVGDGRDRHLVITVGKAAVKSDDEELTETKTKKTTKAAKSAKGSKVAKVGKACKAAKADKVEESEEVAKVDTEVSGSTEEVAPDLDAVAATSDPEAEQA